ncbi:MAG: ribonuclease H-like domain-containing protein [Planctomycetes bacterium]|nr:ribonuclease H-like domain-containing protein [Planctomycetota bacterium]
MTLAGTAWARVERFPAGARHGGYRLDEAFAAEPTTWPLLTGDKALTQVSAEGAVFLDTETTGLSGGVGTFVWMVGLGRFLPGGGFEVWQAYLPGPEAEVPFLHAVAERIAAAGSVVSFFGRSYDQHRLLDRLRVHGLASPFDGRPHLDLFAPLRRLVGDDLPNHRLQTLERELCGHQRVDDLPGAAAPEAWFDSLAGRAHRMEGVFRHNLEDVLSLVTLFAASGRSLAGLRAGGEELAGCSEQRRLALARAALERRAPGQAAGLAASEPPSREDLRWRWLALRSLGLARSGQVTAARELLEREGDLGEPSEEPAARDAVEAALLRARLALRASEEGQAAAALSRARARLERAGERVRGLERRLADLERRLGAR